MGADYTIEYRGLTLGAGTPFPFERVEGLEELPPLRTGDVDRSYRHGMIPGLDLASGRTIVVQLLVFPASSTFAARVEALKAISTPTVDEEPLVFTLPGRLSRSLRCRPRRRALPVDLDYSFQYGRATLEFFATDPRIYDENFTSGALSLPTADTGLAFNAAAPFVFGTTGSGGSLPLTNAGNIPAPWVAVIAGPVTDPSLTLAATGQTVRLIGTVNAGETLTIDSAAPAVLLNGTASRYSWVQNPTVWWEIPVGPSAVQFNAASGTGTCTFSYRSAWL